MVPGLDMVNHSAVPTAYYEEDDKDDVVLLLRPDPGVSCGEEITISYGERKSAAEMLFSYGFVDPDSPGQELVLPFKPLSDDPLGRVKVHISNSIPSVKISRTDGKLKWESPFAYLMVLNEEDGLDFRVLQDTNGERQLRLFWLEEDVTDRSAEFETLIQQHTLCSVFELRTVALLQEVVTTQLARLEDSGFTHDELQSLQAAGQLREECVLAVEALRVAEVSLLQEVAEAWEIQVRQLCDFLFCCFDYAFALCCFTLRNMPVGIVYIPHDQAITFLISPSHKVHGGSRIDGRDAWPIFPGLSSPESPESPDRDLSPQNPAQTPPRLIWHSTPSVRSDFAAREIHLLSLSSLHLAEPYPMHLQSSTHFTYMFWYRLTENLRTDIVRHASVEDPLISGRPRGGISRIDGSYPRWTSARANSQ